jgi:predicted MFS family arabinose efflux permease
MAALALSPLVWKFLPERPSDRGLAPVGAPGDHVEPPAPAGGTLTLAFGALARAARTRTFWLLFTGFFICGLTTNGLVGTHLIAMCADQGMAQVQAAGLLAVMGVFDLAGTTASGWLTDRYDPRRLLAIYYTFRGLALVALPFSDFSLLALGLFAVFFGLDWIATVPPTARLATEAFGLREGPIVFGWIAAGHQAGAATAAITAGVMRASQGRYLEAFVLAGLTALIAAVASLMIRRGVVSAAA